MHPYLDKPDYQFWKKAGGISDPLSLDPVTKVSFKISKDEKVVTAGSCFAQHVAKRLSDNGFNYFVTERAHPVIPETVATANNYGMFSARYGNIYTARQLRQLIERVWGQRHPIEHVWLAPNGRFVDPFRPQIQPNGFISPAELTVDRRQHFEAVRSALENMSTFVFTLGLTEAWQDKRDNSVFPLAPGVAGGTFIEDIHEFINFSFDETVADLTWSLNHIRLINPTCKIILTVSPVPLNATAVDRHVLVSTTYSKAVLRLTAEEVCNQFEQCDYFPSYEIITAPHVGALYFGADKRSVTTAGVDHVMGLFLKHYGDNFSSSSPSLLKEKNALDLSHKTAMEDVIQVLCDEEAINNE